MYILNISVPWAKFGDFNVKRGRTYSYLLCMVQCDQVFGHNTRSIETTVGIT